MKKSLLMAMMFAVGMTACINDEVPVNNVPDNNQPEQELAGKTVFSFVVPNTSLTGRDAEDSGIHEVGTAKEYAVNKVRLYLFSTASENFYASVDVKGISAPAVEGTQVTYTSEAVALNPGSYRVFAVANAADNIVNPSTIDELLAKIDSDTYKEALIQKCPDAGIIMTNRGAQSKEVTIESHKTNKVEITLERVLAKILLKSSKADFPLTDVDGNTYVEISPVNYAMVNLNKEYYLFRHVAKLADAPETPATPAAWAKYDNFDVIPATDGYAIDPHFFEKTVAGALTFDGSFFVNPLVNNNALNFSGTIGTGTSSIYCLENCMFRPAQKQAYTTGIVIKCALGIPETHCLDENGNQVAEGNRGDELYYFNQKFYTSLAAVKANTGANIPTTAVSDVVLNKDYNIKRFEANQGSFQCYYNYWIKHLDNNDASTMGVMEFGIVRNNIYDITIADIAGLGTGYVDNTPDIDDEKKGYLDADFNVMPWIVRAQSGVLE